MLPCRARIRPNSKRMVGRFPCAVGTQETIRTQPRGTSRSTWSTAVIGPKRWDSPCVQIAYSVIDSSYIK